MLEILGLGLAIIDFFDLTGRLEEGIDRSRDRLQAFTRSIKQHQAATETFLLWFNGICFVLLTVYLIVKTSSLPWAARLILAPIVAYFGTGIYSLMFLAALIAVYYLVLSPLAVILRLLDLPKRGTVGSIGLLLAVAGVVIRFVG